jgi:xylulokinase
MNARQYVLAIDLGTSGPKVALVSDRGEIAGREVEPIETLRLPGGGAEQRPAGWWAALVAASRRLLARGLVPVDAIAAISCTAQWAGTVAVDAAGEPLMNAILWMDTRGAPYVAEAIGGHPGFRGYGVARLLRWIRLTGGAPARAGNDPLGHILYLKHARPEIYRAAHKLLEPKDYLNLKLTGRFAASFDSISVHWVTDNRDIHHIAYDDILIARAGLSRDKLPDLVRAASVLGTVRPEIARELGIRPDVVVIAGTPDMQSAAIGSGAVGDGEAHLYLGTSSWITCHVPFKKTDAFHSMTSLPAAIPGRYFVAASQDSAGACLTFLRDNILFHEDELRTPRPEDALLAFEEIAARVPAGSGRVIFTPWLTGERTPVDDRTVRGGFFNQSAETTREHMIRAVLEGVAFNSRWMLGIVEPFVGRRLDPIRIIGGGARSRLWCQIHADVLDRTIQQVEDPLDANVRGAGLLAGLALGWIQVEDMPASAPIAETFAPDPARRALYDELFHEFVSIYRSTRKIYARLNRAA